MKSPITRIALFLLLHLAAAGAGYGIDYSWNASGTAGWSTGSSWSPSGPPGATDTVINPLRFGNALIFGSPTVGEINLTNLTSSWTILPVAVSTANPQLTISGNVSKAGDGNFSFINQPTKGLLVSILGNLNLSSGNLFLGNSSTEIASVQVAGQTTVSGGLLATRGSSIAFNGGLSIGSGGVVSASGLGAATGTTGFTAASLSGAGQLKANNGNAVDGAVTINGAGGTTTFSGQLTDGSGGTGKLSITKSGSGTQIFSGASNDYTGGTTINGGTLLVNNAGGSGLGGGAVAINGGVLGGTGSFTGAVVVNSGGTLSPGSSIESLGTGTNTWNGGGTILFEFSTDGGTGSAGAQWDLLSITGNLDLSGASSGNPFLVNLITMASASSPGVLATWDPNVDHTWAGFVTTTTGILGFSANKFAINTSAFQNTLNGTFHVVQNGTNLDLAYTAVPEPGTWILLAGSLTALMIFRARCRT